MRIPGLWPFCCPCGCRSFNSETRKQKQKTPRFRAHAARTASVQRCSGGMRCVTQEPHKHSANCLRFQSPPPAVMVPALTSFNRCLPPRDKRRQPPKAQISSTQARLCGQKEDRRGGKKNPPFGGIRARVTWTQICTTRKK